MQRTTYESILLKMKKFSVETCLDKRFSELTTLGCGGKICITIFPTTERQLVKSVKLFRRLKVAYCMLGRGSNVLASDYDYDGVVIVTSKMKAWRITGRKAYALAGASTVSLANELKQRGLAGGEFLACLPASIGGATVTNAGCYGQQMKDIVRRVKVLKGDKIRRLNAKLCRFGKRKSIFSQEDDYVIVSVEMKFARGNAEDIGRRIADMRAKKAASQPLNFRSAGSALYHDKVAVSRLLDIAGLKGYTVGRAQVSTKHAGFVVNLDKATSRDIYLIIRYMQWTLLKRFGLDAHIEIRLINFAKDVIEDDDLFTAS